MRCSRCYCQSEKAPGWVAMLVPDPDDEGAQTVAVLCPPCAARELRYEPKVAYT